MQQPMDARPNKPKPKSVTYVIVVHGIGEQRKNETVINVVNRFAEARRRADAADNRDVLTLGQASGQTGVPKLSLAEQPWIEFDGIPAMPPCPNSPNLKVFLGEPSSTGDNLRFVDLYWSDVMQESIADVGQDVSVWAKGLLGRLLRKHDDAVSAHNCGARVPLWIRRVLYLLADTLLLVRFAMNFRFKKMKDLVFVKFLGDVQLYGEYSRCRGRAVRRFHEIMAKIEAEHAAGDEGNRPRYVVIAHSLGSIMSFDALLYGRATCAVRLGRDGDWVFPGYLGADDEVCECEHAEAKGRFAFLDTGWIDRVQSFVTLGSPIDKYLTIWWLNYRYLLKCDGRLQPTNSRIPHFNYCDELDPVGHNLDVVRQTPAYRSAFECREDVVFNRYAAPGAAHNEYWTDQDLFDWMLARGVDGEGGCGRKPPRWFSSWVYCRLLFWLYGAVPLLILLGTYASLSLAFQAQGWRTAAIAAAAFSLLAYLGRRLIDLSIWWRQIQRQQSETIWEGGGPDDHTDPEMEDQPYDGGGLDPKQRRVRRWAAWLFRVLIVVVPFAWAALTMAALLKLDPSTLPNVVVTGSAVRLALVLALALVIFGLLVLRRLPAAYRTRAVDDDGNLRPIVESVSLVLVFVAIIVVAHVLAPVRPVEMGQVALFGLLATAVYAYRLYRFTVVRSVLRGSQPQAINYSDYACHP